MKIRVDMVIDVPDAWSYEEAYSKVLNWKDQYGTMPYLNKEGKPYGQVYTIKVLHVFTVEGAK